VAHIAEMSNGSGIQNQKIPLAMAMAQAQNE
jgi:hypothetical protein